MNGVVYGVSWAMNRVFSTGFLVAVLASHWGCGSSSHKLPNVSHQSVAVTDALKWVEHARRRSERYQPLDQRVLGQLRTAAAELREHGHVTQLPRGYSLEKVVAAELDGALLVLREAEPVHGGGVFVVRTALPSGTAPQTEWIVEVPHSFFDRQTLPIGWGLFDQLHARALLVNTVHRYRGAGCERNAAQCPSDMARNDLTAFHGFHRGLTETEAGPARPGQVVIAVHGFQKRSDDPDIIVSGAGTDMNAFAIKAALTESLAAFGVEVAAFPDDVGRLGGVASVQGRHLTAIGGRLLHVELADSARDRLVREPALRQAFSLGLQQALLEAEGDEAPRGLGLPDAVRAVDQLPGDRTKG